MIIVPMNNIVANIKKAVSINSSSGNYFARSLGVSIPKIMSGYRIEFDGSTISIIAKNQTVILIFFINILNFAG